MSRLIYLDYQATTPVDEKVFRVMEPYFSQDFGNAASKSHVFGWKAEAAVEVAREQIAAVLGAKPEEIIFTSGATESNNLTLLGLARGHSGKKQHIITVQTEHKAILDPCRQLEREGFSITYLPVNQLGKLDLNQVRDALQPETLMISVMAANNEVGTLAPLQEIGKMAREAEVFFHSDAAQAAGKIPLNVEAANLDFLSLSAHKFYGPKGIGALYIRDLPRRRSQIQPLVFGGGHEQGLRSGTLNVPAIVGMGAALKLSEEIREKENKRLATLRDKLWHGLQERISEIFLNGAMEERLAHNINCGFGGIKSSALLMELKDVALSSGSACTSANPEPSHVLRALGLSKEEAESSIRFSLGRPTTQEEIDIVIERVAAVVEKLRQNC